MSKTKKSEAKRIARQNKALRELEPVMIPLLELFAVCDDVFTEEDAFANEHIKQSLGRCLRQWKKTRLALDPSFDPKDYDKRPRKVGSRQSSPLASAVRRSSSAQRSTSEKNENRSAGRGKKSAKKSAKRAR